MEGRPPCRPSPRARHATPIPFPIRTLGSQLSALSHGGHAPVHQIVNTVGPAVLEAPTHAPIPVMIEQVNPEEDPHWDASLRGWPQASLFHSAAWQRVLRESYGFIPGTLIAREGSAV